MPEYIDLLKSKEYRDVANILKNDIDCRRDNRKLLIKYYKDIYGLTLDEAFRNNAIPNYQTIERYARKLKEVNDSLKWQKDEDIYKQIALDIPVVVEVF